MGLPSNASDVRAFAIANAGATTKFRGSPARATSTSRDKPPVIEPGAATTTTGTPGSATSGAQCSVRR